MVNVTTTYPQYDSRTIDVKMQLADDAGNSTGQQVTTGAALQVASAAAVLDVGASQIQFDVQVDMLVVDATTGDELSLLLIQGSNSPTFASGNVNLAVQAFGDSSKTGESADNLGDERLIISGSNVRKGTIYRYIRGYILGTGTTPIANIKSAYLCVRND